MKNHEPGNCPELIVFEKYLLVDRLGFCYVRQIAFKSLAVDWFFDEINLKKKFNRFINFFFLMFEK